MKQNKYDDGVFFEKYSGMARSQQGLAGAGEWHELEKLLPNFTGKRALDLGCGFGWHCRHAAEHGAVQVVGVDISERMLEKAREMTSSDKVTYIQGAIEDVRFPAGSFDVVLSSLALHYVKDLDAVWENVEEMLVPGGQLVFSAEHPVFTAEGSQQWFHDSDGNILHWPVDNYYHEGARTASFLGEEVTKYHRTLTSYLGGLLRAGFEITAVVEPAPSDEARRTVPGMEEEMRRPMMMLVSARKKGDNTAKNHITQVR